MSNLSDAYNRLRTILFPDYGDCHYTLESKIDTLLESNLAIIEHLMEYEVEEEE